LFPRAPTWVLRPRFFQTTQLRLSFLGRKCADLIYRRHAGHQFHRGHLRGDLESGSLNICRLWCSSPVHRPFGDALSIMHSACRIGNAELGIVPGAGSPHLSRGKLMYDSSAFWMKLFELADPTGNPRNQSSLVRRSRVLFAGPAFSGFNTFNARLINGSTPFSISAFSLSSLISTGTPLPS
jgi:hypothetical protein